MSSELKANKVSPATGTALQIGDSGDTITIPSGATLTNSGTLSGFGDNTPGFHANLSADATISDATFTKVAFNSETYDSDSAYDGAGKFTVPSGEGGKYFVYSFLVISSNAGASSNDIETMQVLLKKNGSNAAVAEWDTNGYGHKMVLGFTCVLDLSASDYLEVFGYMDSSTSSNCTVAGDAYPRSYFGAYKMIGV
jgi:hypothetical protein